MDYFAFRAVYIDNFLTRPKTGWSSSVDHALFSSNSTGSSDLFSVEITQ